MPLTKEKVLQKNTSSDKKNGINSTLLDAITILMMRRGEADISIETIIAVKPEIDFLLLGTKMVTNTMMKNTTTIKIKYLRILAFSPFGANFLKIQM